MGLFRKSLIISFKEKSIFRFDYLVGTVFAFFYILFDGSIERFKEEHAGEGVSDRTSKICSGVSMRKKRPLCKIICRYVLADELQGRKRVRNQNRRNVI